MSLEFYTRSMAWQRLMLLSQVGHAAMRYAADRRLNEDRERQLRNIVAQQKALAKLPVKHARHQ